jgi:hypothetical protein
MEKKCNHIGHEGKDDNGRPYCMWCDATLPDKNPECLNGCVSDGRECCYGMDKISNCDDTWHTGEMSTKECPACRHDWKT